MCYRRHFILGLKILCMLKKYISNLSVEHFTALYAPVSLTMQTTEIKNRQGQVVEEIKKRDMLNKHERNQENMKEEQ